MCLLIIFGNWHMMGKVEHSHYLLKYFFTFQLKNLVWFILKTD